MATRTDEADEIPRHHSRVDKRAPRKTAGVCPLCGKRIGRTNKGTRYLRNCKNCGATLNKEVECPHCRTRRVWTGKLGAVCHGCGKVVPRS